MSADLERLFKSLGNDGHRAAERAFKGACGNMMATAKQLAPVGHYKRARGKGGITGGHLKASLKVEYLGKDETHFFARCTSELPYANRQHEGNFHHPGLYTRGAAGPRYRSAFFERAFVMIFDGKPDPLNGLGAMNPKQRRTFQELLVDYSS